MSTPQQQINFAVGAARKFTEDLFGGPVTEIETTVVASASGVAASVIAENNGDRVSLTMINLGPTVSVNVGTDQLTTGATSGITIPPGGLFNVNVRDDFTLPTRRWVGVSQAGAQQVKTLEVVRISLSQLVETTS